MNNNKHRLPGDPTKEQYIEQIIRVNHAGEYGAKRIYEGQLAILKNTKEAPIIEHMKQQELKHLEYFENSIVNRKIRPTLLQPLWHIAGFALGAGTALLGTKAAMACTVAVEEVIDEHYQKQLDTLGDDEKDLKDHIQTFQNEEAEHKDIGLEHNAQQAPGYSILSSAVKAASKLAIFLSKKI